ncbi:hypothetical protein GQR58_017660 [Nymphon striatum]|nr:hypothetical protein GQR58_017660 [Nymphon striatum]
MLLYDSRKIQHNHVVVGLFNFDPLIISKSVYRVDCNIGEIYFFLLYGKYFQGDKDEKYKQRRQVCADIAFNYKHVYYSLDMMPHGNEPMQSQNEDQIQIRHVPRDQPAERASKVISESSDCESARIRYTV